jgi:hypothetical protein
VADQPIAFSASQPRSTATDARPSSAAIQSATFRLDHNPPSGAGTQRRARSFSRSSGFCAIYRQLGAEISGQCQALNACEAQPRQGPLRLILQDERLVPMRPGLRAGYFLQALALAGGTGSTILR